MSGVVVSSGFVVTPGVDDLNADSPIIGYHNVVDASNISATSEDSDFPAGNLANPSTYLRWKSGMGSPVTDDYITVDLTDADPVDIDYLAIARHNLGSGQMPVSLEIATTDPGSPGDWTEVITERLLSNDNPTIFRFTKQPLYAVRLRIQPSQAAVPVLPTIAVVYAGELLVLQRRIFVGHTPLPLGRKIQVANHRSIAGAFLGRIVLSHTRSTSFSLQNLTQTWYRQYFDPFVVAAQEIPFFFGWRPGSFPYEAGFAWLVNDPMPENQLPNGLMQVDLDLEGIA